MGAHGDPVRRPRFRVVLHLIHDRGMDPQAVADMLYKQSGLLSMSGLSSDTRVLFDSDLPAAEEALNVYCYRIAREVGSLAVALGGLDAVVFSGDVGENSPKIRTEIVRHLNWLGVELDPIPNDNNQDVLSPAGASIPVLRFDSDEERIIARDCASLL